MRHPRLRFLVTPLVIAVFASVALVAQNAKEDAADAEFLVKALEVRPGSVVGEIGAGGGELSIAMAKAVGDSGRVFSNELHQGRQQDLRKKFDGEGLKNVTLVEGRAHETNFADACCDAIFMRNVYHHFDDPPAMNGSLFRSLKPGGRLVVFDFAPDGDEAATPSARGAEATHGIKAPTVERELIAAGFEIVSSSTSKHKVTVVALRPKESE